MSISFFPSFPFFYKKKLVQDTLFSLTCWRREIETKGELSIRHYDFSDQATVSRVDRKRVFSGKGVEAAQSQEIVSRQGGRRQQDYTGEE